MGNTKKPKDRGKNIKYWQKERMITIESVLDFDIVASLKLLLGCNLDSINIGANSGNNKMPEPPEDKLNALINKLNKDTHVRLKKNLKRILPQHELHVDEKKGV
jgi:hypothetical protein